jgi:hypothetical protein
VDLSDFESIVTGLFSGGVPGRCVANAPTSTSPGTSAPSPLDFLLRLGALLVGGSGDRAPFSGGNGSVIVGRRDGRRDDCGKWHAGLREEVS